ncbi:hypothetical protein [Cognatiluteimonas telluris]|uniref:hypothetical protein n=1 Tax=Cognatiluteimonas telluris TaxID=1104775 RepID=UPI001A9C870F|nr:hypothetical protein [Lysobacter telluris]
MDIPDGMVQCSMNHRLYTDSSLGIWDEGAWISWEYIDEHAEEMELRREFPKASIELINNFQSLLDAAAQYKVITGRYLDIWGELGEVYAEVKYGLKRHRYCAPGSDGKIGNDFCEVKTITPMKSVDRVQVKRAGNFNKLLIVKIDGDYNFTSRLIDRKVIGKGSGKFARVGWSHGDAGGA